MELLVIAILAFTALGFGLYWLWKYHSVLNFDINLMWSLQARCICGKFIRGCRHVWGVPSTWEHAEWPHDHWHYDQNGKVTTMVEHV